MILNRSILLTIAATLLVGIIIGGLAFSGGSNENMASAKQHDHSQESGEWTCSMHPQVRQAEPGSCPFCGMDLIPATSGADEDPKVLKMTKEAIALANIQTTTIGEAATSNLVQLNGKIKVDERAVKSQTTHFGGRIEQLYKNSTGEYVQKGEAIASIYSPELVAAQEEFLEAKRMAKSNPVLFEATKKKLKFWKISDEQIAEIAAKGHGLQEIKLLSQFAGVITKKMVNNGDHLMEGQTLLEIADLSKLWVVFEVYEKDIDLFSLGQKIIFQRNGASQKHEAIISFISPEVNPRTRIIEIRADIKSSTGLLKPDMFVSGEIQTDSQSSLTVPRSAVLWTGKRSIVYIKNKGELAFELREISLGKSLGDAYQVLSGLQSGDEVVSNGAFTIDAEAQLRGKSSMMMQVTNEKAEVAGFSEIALSTFEDYTAQTDPTFQNQLMVYTMDYLVLKDAMVAGDKDEILIELPKLKNSLAAVNMGLVKGDAHMHWMELLEAMDKSIVKIELAPNRDKQRLEFINLSNALINAVKSFGTNTDNPLYIQFCPMANNDQGANWISKEENIINPYFGDMMLTCGSVEEVITANN